jgi:hypothetical protein
LRDKEDKHTTVQKETLSVQFARVLLASVLADPRVSVAD